MTRAGWPATPPSPRHHEDYMPCYRTKVLKFEHLLVHFFVSTAGVPGLRRRPLGQQRLDISEINYCIRESRGQLESSMPFIQMKMIMRNANIMPFPLKERPNGARLYCFSLYQCSWEESYSCKLTKKGLGPSSEVPFSYNYSCN